MCHDNIGLVIRDGQVSGLWPGVMFSAAITIAIEVGVNIQEDRFL